MDNSTAVSNWNKPAVKNTFEAQIQEHIDKFKPMYFLYKDKKLDLTQGGFEYIIQGYILRVCVFDGDFEGAYTRVTEFFAEHGWGFLTKWKEEYKKTHK